MGLIFTGSIYIYLDNARKKIDVENILSKYNDFNLLNGKLEYEDIVGYINTYLDNLNYKKKYETDLVYKEAFKYSFSNILKEVLYNHILNNKIDLVKIKDNNSELNKITRNLSLAFEKIDSIIGVNSNYEFTQIDLNNDTLKEDININIYLSNLNIDKNKLNEFLESQLIEFKSNLNQTGSNLRNKYLYDDAIIYKNIKKNYKKANILSPNRITLKKCLSKMRDNIVNAKILTNIEERKEYFNYIDKDIKTNTLNLNDLDVYININSIIKSIINYNALNYKDLVNHDIAKVESSLDFENKLRHDLEGDSQVKENIDLIEDINKELSLKK